MTEHLAGAIGFWEQRDFRHTAKLTAKEYHGRLVSDFEGTQEYHEAARELTSEQGTASRNLTDTEKINLEMIAQRQNDEAERQKYLDSASSDNLSQQLRGRGSRSR